MRATTRSVPLAALAAVLLVALWPTTARACSCGELATADVIAEAAGHPDVVVALGLVEAVAAAPVPDDEPREAGTTLTYTLGVERVWGGELSATTYVEAASDASACGLDVAAGTRVAWRLHGGASGPWQTGLCEVLSTAELRAATGGDTPSPDPPDATAPPAASVAEGADDAAPRDRSSDPAGAVVLVGLVALAAAALAGALATRRRRSDT